MYLQIFKRMSKKYLAILCFIKNRVIRIFRFKKLCRDSIGHFLNSHHTYNMKLILINPWMIRMSGVKHYNHLKYIGTL